MRHLSVTVVMRGLSHVGIRTTIYYLGKSRSTIRNEARTTLSGLVLIVQRLEGVNVQRMDLED